MLKKKKLPGGIDLERLKELAEKAAKENLVRAMKAAKYGPEVKKLSILGHKWNIKKYQKSTVRPQIAVNGQISHHLTGRPDDQIYYVITMNQHVVTSINVKIKDGGLSPIAAPFIAALGTYFSGLPIPSGAVEAIGRQLGRAVDGDSWRSVVQYLVANIAIRV